MTLKSTLATTIIGLTVLVSAAAEPGRATGQSVQPHSALEALGTLMPGYGVPSTNMWAEGGLLYAEAVDPVSNTGPFVVYDVLERRVVYAGREDIHTGFRNIMIDADGNAYFSVNGTGLARYDRRANDVHVLDVTLPGTLRASAGPDPAGMLFGISSDSNATIWRLDPGEQTIETLGSAWGYTTSAVLGPDGRSIYFVPGAHGSAWRLGTPVIRFDTHDRSHEVIAFLGPYFEEEYGYRLGGTYAISLDRDGRRLFINMNAVNLNDTPGARSAFGHPAVVVVHLDSQPSYELAFSDAGDRTGLSQLLQDVYIHAASWGDTDGDGWPDLFAGAFVGGEATQPSRLLLNERGRFVAAEAPALRRPGRAAGSVFADLDGDGDLDLVVSHNRISGRTGSEGEPSRLYRNDNGAFTDVTATSGLEAQSSNGRQVGVLDFDGDGLLDLFITGDAFRGGGPTLLFRNRGGLMFENATSAAGIPEGVHGLGLAIGDATGNGWPDIFVAGGPSAAESFRNYLFVARGDGTYMTRQGGDLDWEPYVTGNEDWVSSGAWGDLNRDGRLDLVVGHHFGTAAERGVGAPVRLYLNRGTGDEGPLLEDVTDRAGLPPIVSKAPHVEIRDMDNDGWPDIVVSVRIETMDGPAPLVFQHQGLEGGVPRFAAPDIVEPHYYAGGPVEDYNRDGRLDVFLPEWRAVLGAGGPPSMLMENTSKAGNWLAVVPEPGTRAGGIGTRISVFEAGQAGEAAALVAMAEIGLGSGFSSSSSAIAHFGLGSRERVDLVVRMPGSEPVVFPGIAANRTIPIPGGLVEPAAHQGLEDAAISVTSERLLIPPETANLPPHQVAASPPRVDFVPFPLPPYRGNPWSQWGAGLVASDGLYYAGIGDHLGVDGNAWMYAYDPLTLKLRAVGDIHTATDHMIGSWGHGKIHGMFNEGPDGAVYFTSYWGTRNNLRFDDAYQGSVVFRYPLQSAPTGSEARPPATDQPPDAPTPTAQPPSTPGRLADVVYLPLASLK